MSKQASAKGLHDELSDNCMTMDQSTCHAKLMLSSQLKCCILWTIRLQMCTQSKFLRSVPARLRSEWHHMWAEVKARWQVLTKPRLPPPPARTVLAGAAACMRSVCFMSCSLAVKAQSWKALTFVCMKTPRLMHLQQPVPNCLSVLISMTIQTDIVMQPIAIDAHRNWGLTTTAAALRKLKRG